VLWLGLSNKVYLQVVINQVGVIDAARPGMGKTAKMMKCVLLRTQKVNVLLGYIC
jgi:hypothetical protein